MKRLKKHDQQTVNLPGMRWRVIFLCLGLSIVLAGFSMPWFDTVVLQVQDMAAMVTQVEVHIDQSVLRALHANGKILPVRRAFQLSADTKGDRPDFESFRSMDPDNGLYWYLDLLTLLRARESAASQPTAGDGEVLERLHRLQIAPPARIYLSRQRKIAQAAYRKAGLSVRRSAFEADRARYRFGYLVEKHRPVLRELADRLMERGTIWRESGRADDARIAFLAVIRLMVDLIDDSPLPDVTLLAAEGLPKALAAIGGDDEAHRVEDFRKRWHARALNDRVNLLPLIGDFAMAPSAHRRVLRSFCAGGL
ncbi:MAG: hypothetical protein JSV03_06680, partial [Planctomycetota bacterium]